MNKPAQSPLHTCANGDCSCGQILDQESSFVATCPNPDNQRRLVACWNACRGLSVEDLETKGLTTAFGNQMLKVERQRDELLAALEGLMEVSVTAPDPYCSCHLSPPCNDCVEWGGLREAWAFAQDVIAGMTKEAS